MITSKLENGFNYNIVENGDDYITWETIFKSAPQKFSFDKNQVKILHFPMTGSGVYICGNADIKDEDLLFNRDIRTKNLEKYLIKK